MVELLNFITLNNMLANTILQPTITFHGGAGTVTGSKILMHYRQTQLLIDCGVFQGLKEYRSLNRAPLPFDATALDGVILTHAHLDHSGALPLLVKAGFKGTIYCTKPTFDLAKIILLDSAKIQEEDADRANRHGYSKHDQAIPLYTREHAELTLALFSLHNYEEDVSCGEDVTFSFHNAGHIVGSSWIKMNVGGKRVIFSGDIGRSQPILLDPPDKPQQADHIIMESTYGDRLHPESNAKEVLREVVLSTIEKGGTLMIPTFAVERAQEIIFLLKELREENKIPAIPTYLDSPMGIDATETLMEYPDWHKLDKQQSADLCKHISLVDTVAFSKEVVGSASPKIVLAGSGMLTGGRIIHYLKHYLGSKLNTILLVGFQAVGTRGRSLLNGAHELKFFGSYHPVKAEVKQITSFSAHADQQELLDWLSELEEKPKTIILDHGEPDASQALRVKLNTELDVNAMVAKPGITYTLY